MGPVGEVLINFHPDQPQNRIYVAYFMYPAFLFRPSIVKMHDQIHFLYKISSLWDQLVKF